MGEALQSSGVQDGGTLQLQMFGRQGRAEGAHQSGDGGPDHIPAQLLLEGPEDGVVEEGAALKDDVLSQVVGAGSPDDLIDGVFHDRDAQPRADVLHAGSILLGLFDAGIHEHSAAGP